MRQILSWGISIPAFIALEIGGVTMVALPDAEHAYGWTMVIVGGIILCAAIVYHIRIWKKRKHPKKGIEVKPVTGKRTSDWEKTERLMWAELAVTNTSSQELENVQVNITECLTLQKKQDSKNKKDFVMWDFLKLGPFCVYWSERQAQPNQMNLAIPSGATRSTLIAFQDNSNGGSFNFNTMNHNWVVGGVKIAVEISSHESVLWRGDFYIECHPNYFGGEKAKFEFLEWDKWVIGRNITLIHPDSEGS
jgi:hypothetical protein